MHIMNIFVWVMLIMILAGGLTLLLTAKTRSDVYWGLVCFLLPVFFILSYFFDFV